MRPVAFSPDGRTLLSGSSDRTIRLWDVSREEPLRTLAGHEGWVFAAEFSPHGRLIASAGGDETIKIWDARSGECLKTHPMSRPYEGINSRGVSGITEAQRLVLKLLGAVEPN